MLTMAVPDVEILAWKFRRFWLV